ncbi:mediator 25, PHYTOCHROME AND FLOWERING TIME 1 [Hibiscus trionum]|uniref:Mediator of RNA polymerase II transcription subunit 25 n=1 Tax=Hibiscus trionum TaxID=183268 RepID=A0A9W7LST4_HIBTR|nr:mediator 25, PHYTOCHROME AND FLOWERING TIME 1 [Hibiscus trionum]
MAERQLIVVVESTAAMGPYWQTILSDYLEKIIRSFCSNELAGQKNSTSNVELSLIAFNTHGSHWAFLVQRSGWTKDVDIFLQWLSALPFSGGCFNDAAIAEGLSEALMMFPIAANGNQTHQIVDGQRHCILVAASNPYPLPTPVYRPQTLNLEQRENMESQIESRLSDAETVAKSFPQCSVSLSVICPKQLSKLKAIYMAGKRNPRAPDPPIENVRNPQFLVLISENFMEGHAALSHPGVPSLAPNQSPVKIDMASVNLVTGTSPTSVPSVNGSMSRQPVSVGNVPSATVKVEPKTITAIATGPAFSHIPSVPRAMIPTPGMPQPVKSEMQTLGVNSSSAASMPQSKYVKFWEGNLFGIRQGQPVFITKLEGYRLASASETLAAHWPQNMRIDRIIFQDHMKNNIRYAGKADFLVFRAMIQHGFLEQLRLKKLCAVIQLPSQTLLLSVTDKPCRLIGYLFPGEVRYFLPRQHQQQQMQQVPQLPYLQQQQQQQLSQMQQQPQLPQLQQPQPQQQQMVGSGMGSGYVQGSGRSQLVSQGQVSSQASSNMPGGGFMS